MKVGAIDIGTNSTRLLVAEAADGGLRWLEHRVVITRLGAGVDAQRRLSAEAIDRTVTALRRHREAMDRWSVDGWRAVATSATRDAANREAFLDAAEAVLGGRPATISGDEEARLSFVGATAGLDEGAPFLVVDPGGGSTEFVYGSTAPEWTHSIDIGSVRLTERMLPTRPSPIGDLLAASASVESMFGQLDLPKEPGTVLGVGGTYTSLAAIHLDQAHYDRFEVHRSVLPLEAIAELVGRLGRLTSEETAAIPSLDPGRADVILAGAVIAEAAVRRSGAASITVSESDILDGIALELLAH